jgi:ABC-type uncharacterized transport system ATPase subunit
MRIDLVDIKKSFGKVRANDGVSLALESGVIQGLLGENGAGKTTLMKILSGYQSLDAGEIRVDGRPVRFASPAEAIRAGIGMLHQDPLDVPALSALDNFTLGRGARLLVSRRQARAELAALCDQFGFALDPEALVSSLTVGERQQLELVRLLSLGVRVVILDEPTTGISEPQKKLLFETLHRLCAEGLSVVFVSHKLDEVEELCSNVTVLRQGRVAGSAQAPFSSQQLVEMMFGQCLVPLPREPVPLREPVLVLEDVHAHTPRLDVEHLSLTVRAGEVLGLAGLEGSGQRLLMQACAGLQRILAGRMWIGDEEMTHAPYPRFLAKGVAYVPAARLEEGLVGGLSIAEHVALLRQGAGVFIRWGEIEAQTQAIIGEFNIVGHPHTLVRDLSGGNQQRAMLGLLADHLRLLILEHPTRGLDIGSAQWIWSKLLQRRHDGTAILFTSTDLDELVTYSDRIVVFSGGAMSDPIPANAVTCEQLGYLIGGRQL